MHQICFGLRGQCSSRNHVRLQLDGAWLLSHLLCLFIASLQACDIVTSPSVLYPFPLCISLVSLQQLDSQFGCSLVYLCMVGDAVQFTLLLYVCVGLLNCISIIKFILRGAAPFITVHFVTSICTSFFISTSSVFPELCQLLLHFTLLLSLYRSLLDLFMRIVLRRFFCVSDKLLAIVIW